MEPTDYTLACLYSGTPPNFKLDGVLQAALQDQRLAQLEPQILTRLDGRLISIDFKQQFSIQVTIRLDPLPGDIAALAMHGAKATSVVNNFETLLAAHQSHIMITAKTEGIIQENLPKRRERLYALQALAEHLFQYEQPVLLYSSLAQSFTLPAENPSSYRGEIDSRIFEQAVLTSRGGSVGSGVPIGANILGAHELIGRPVVFPHVRYPSWALTEGSTRFFKLCDESGMPEDGTIFTDESGRAKYGVQHMPVSANYPHGYIAVTVQRHPLASKESLDGSPIYPERIGARKQNNNKLVQKRKVDKAKRMNIVIIIAGICLTFAFATFVSYWQSNMSG